MLEALDVKAARVDRFETAAVRVGGALAFTIVIASCARVAASEYMYTRQEPAYDRKSPTVFVVRVVVDTAAKTVKWTEDRKYELLQAAQEQSDWTSLFNGKDFTGWKIGGPAESFTIEDGAIVTRGATAHAFYDGPVGNHAFRNFELKVDVMTRAGSNGGVYVLTEFQEIGGIARPTGRFPTKGFEIQVNNSHTDRIRTGSLYHVVDMLDNSPAKDNEWFTEHIIVKGDTITVNVNDKQVVRWVQPADWNGGVEGPGRRITGPGTIALQGHDPRSTVYYKNIRIKLIG